MTDVLSSDDHGLTVEWKPAPSNGVDGLPGRDGIDGKDGAKGDPGESIVGPVGPAGPPGVGGAVVGKGYAYLDEFPGTTAADKLRAAWTVARAVVPLPGTTIDAGAQPITVPAGGVLMGLAGPQNEFSATWPLYARATGGTSVFKTAPNGSNWSGSRGWTFSNIGFEGVNFINLFAPNVNPAWWDPAGSSIFAYATIEGCSADNFKTVIDSPLLGCTIDIRYTNNLGAHGYKLGGSDNTLFPMGGKMDSGGSVTDATRPAVLWLSDLEKTSIGPVYITGQPMPALLIEGSSARDGVVITGATFEGRNRDLGAAGAVIRQTGGGVTLYGANVNFGMRNPAATGRADKGIVHVTGGRMLLDNPIHRPCAGVTAPFVHNAGGTVKVRDGIGIGTALTYSGTVSVA